MHAVTMFGMVFDTKACQTWTFHGISQILMKIPRFFLVMI